MVLKRKSVTLLVVAIVFVAVYGVIAPMVIERILTAKLRDIYSQQATTFTPQITKLVGYGPSRTELQCYGYHDYWTAHRDCENHQVYTFRLEAIPITKRPQILEQSRHLDELLLRNGWRADRQQDAIKTIAGSVPTTPLPPFHIQVVPFHKNFGKVSCNMEIAFYGTRQNDLLGSIHVNRFSCQQSFDYFWPHARTHKHYGG
jgi:hypothetical protein